MSEDELGKEIRRQINLQRRMKRSSEGNDGRPRTDEFNKEDPLLEALKKHHGEKNGLEQ